MPKKAIDARIPALIRNSQLLRHRSLFIIIGEHSKDVIVNLYHILLNLDIKLNKSVLWAYKKELLGFSSHRKKREKKIKAEIKRGQRDVDEQDPFELFVSTRDVRYVYYKETEKILGQTFGMCVLQDFEGLTPNLLARTMETVEGGGMVLLLLKNVKSLKQLYTMNMDVHARYRTEAHGDVVARFNERFLMSLGSCGGALVIDDEMNVLSSVSGARGVVELKRGEVTTESQKAKEDLAEIKENLEGEKPIGDLVKLAKTVDQAKALMTFVEAIMEKTLASTVTLTAGRGRGKSAALGMAIAAAIACGYSNIFITSPSPENLKTLFEFIFKGFDELGYLDHTDYDIVQSTNPDFNKAIVRVNVHRDLRQTMSRQTIQYIRPEDSYTLGQAELLVIDEAAAIPLPLVRQLLGPYLVFMASTINGYEGTGRSLSLKLIQQLRDQSRNIGITNGDTKIANRDGNKKDEGTSRRTARSLREIELNEPIRYASGDAVEKWMNSLLCLDATLPRQSKIHGTPHPSDCELLQVNRDTLFSFHPVTEKFLQQMMALYVASHYKNSPNDLQLMSDAPAHQLFVLVAPTEDGAKKLPEILCVIQVALEGQISRESVLNSLSRGQRAGGDLIPWLVSQQFQDSEFAGLSGARIVRIATNPDYGSMGYGSRALQLLNEFYEGKHINLSEDDAILAANEEQARRVTDEELAESSLQTEVIKVREFGSMPPLFARLHQRRPPALDYTGVSYGLTQPLHKFWYKAGYVPVYLRQTANDLTGEHTMVMLKPTNRDSTDPSWLGAYAQDFHRRIMSLASYQFRTFSTILVLSIDDSSNKGVKLLSDSQKARPLTKSDLDNLLSPYDIKRLKSYADNMLDYHVILDLMPKIADLYFTGRIKDDNGIVLSAVQKALLCAIGLQRKMLEDMEKELNLTVSQLLAMFIKVMRKISTHFEKIQSGAIEASMPATTNGGAHPAPDDDEADRAIDAAEVRKSLADDLAEGAEEFDEEERQRNKRMIDALPLERYAIQEGEAGWEDAEKLVKEATKKGKAVGTLAVKNSKKGEHKKRKAGEALKEAQEEAEKSAPKEKKHKKSKKSSA